jgi:hypothetical protein
VGNGMDKRSIAAIFSKELNTKHNLEKIKQMQEFRKTAYSIDLEKQFNGKDGFVLSYMGKEGLITFLEDYLDLYSSSNNVNAKKTIKLVSDKIQQLKHGDQSKLNDDEFKPLEIEDVYTIDDIKMMYTEFYKLNEKYAQYEKEINRWIKLKTQFFSI